MSDPAVNDGFLISIWEKDCDKESNPRFQNACLSLVFIFYFSLHPLITHINLLPSTKMRHQFLRH